MNNSQLSVLWNKVIGIPDNEPLEHRIFNVICVLSGIFLVMLVIFNTCGGLYDMAWIFGAALGVLGGLYYLARYKGKYLLSTFVFALCCLLLLIVSYVLNDGVDGPTLLGFFVTIQVIAAVKPSNKFLVWWLVHIAMAASLLLLQYHYPQAIQYTYGRLSLRMYDTFFTFSLTSLLVFFIINYLRVNYHRERLLAEERAKDIEIRNHQLAFINAEKNKLFSIISHDMRSPLASIQSALELLTTGDIDENDKIEIKKELIWLTGNTSDMLNNLLHWSKTQMEQITVNLHTHLLADILAETVALQMKIADRKGIVLSCELEASVYVNADSDMLQLVVRNLINNAIKFTNTGGYVNVRGYQNEGRCQVEVKDNGKGIPAEVQPTIFNPRHEATYGTMNEKGVGLGLVLCKEFIERQGGRIWFESVKDEGSAFYISLPVG